MIDLLKRLISKKIGELIGYPAESPACPIRLDANENPYTMPPFLHEKFLTVLSQVSLNRYPEPGSPSLLARFAEAYGVGRDMLMAGNGSDELIQILCTATAGANVLVPVPTFAMYRISAINNGHKVIEAPLNDDFDLDLPGMLNLVKKYLPALIFLSYPNNPTGNCFSRDKIEIVLRETSGLVVVDEAYGYFSRQSFMPLLKNYENLVILKTLSKIGLAALRIGFLIGRSPLVHELNKVRLPYNLNALSQAAAGFYLDHETIFLDQAAELIKSRDKLFHALLQIEGIRPYRSEANFIFFSCLFNTDTVYSEMRAQGILVKNFKNASVVKNCMRVTVGKEEENAAFLETLQRIIAKLGA